MSSAISYGHGVGQTLEKIVGNYFIDIENDTVVGGIIGLVTGLLLTFVFRKKFSGV